MMVGKGGRFEAARDSVRDKVSVQIELRPSSLLGPGSTTVLPVNVRTLTNRIAATGLTGQSLEIAPGHYLVGVEMPNGSMHVEETEITANTHTVTLAPADTAVLGDVSPTEIFSPFSVDIGGGSNLDIRNILRDGSSAFEDASAKFARQYHDVRASMRGVSIESHENALQVIRAEEVIASTVGIFRRSDRQWVPSEKRNGFASVMIPGENRGLFALFERSGPGGTEQRLAVAIPAAVNWDVEFVVADEPLLRVIPILENGRANALLSYMAQQAYAHVATYSQAQSESDFTELLFSKRSDPIGAAIGGYGLLSLNQFSPLEAWSENLTRVAPWLADGYAIHGETQARLANHEKAAKYFHKMIRVGLPVFSVGLSYAETRLRLYVEHKLPSKQANEEMEAWLKAVSANVLTKLKLGEVLTTVVDPELEPI